VKHRTRYLLLAALAPLTACGPAGQSDPFATNQDAVSERVSMCHVTDNARENICVPRSDFEDHLAQGDLPGRCEETGMGGSGGTETGMGGSGGVETGMGGSGGNETGMGGNGVGGSGGGEVGMGGSGVGGSSGGEGGMGGTGGSSGVGGSGVGGSGVGGSGVGGSGVGGSGVGGSGGGEGGMGGTGGSSGGGSGGYGCEGGFGGGVGGTGASSGAGGTGSGGTGGGGSAGSGGNEGGFGGSGGSSGGSGGTAGSGGNEGGFGGSGGNEGGSGGSGGNEGGSGGGNSGGSGGSAGGTGGSGGSVGTDFPLGYTCQDYHGGDCNMDGGYGDHCAPSDNWGGCSDEKFWAWCNRRNPNLPNNDKPGDEVPPASNIWYQWVYDWVDANCAGEVKKGVNSGGYSFYYCTDYWDAGTQSYPITCTTPLVLAFDGETVSFEPSEHGFSLTASDVDARTDWPSSATPWLAMDRNGNGRIDDGSELFGSATRLGLGETASHGFEALSALDDNGDGVVDANDSSWTRLLVWRDDNADGESNSGELSTVAESRLVSISLRYEVVPRCDIRGNCERERAEIQWRDENNQTRVGQVVDVHLALRSAMCQ
jgi:hypothetical protein